MSRSRFLFFESFEEKDLSTCFVYMGDVTEHSFFSPTDEEQYLEVVSWTESVLHQERRQYHIIFIVDDDVYIHKTIYRAASCVMPGRIFKNCCNLFNAKIVHTLTVLVPRGIPSSSSSSSCSSSSSSSHIQSHLLLTLC